MRLFAWARLWWRRLFSSGRTYQLVGVASMSAIPENLGNRIYIVGQTDNPKWAVLACPCPNRERIDVNLMRSRSPSWRIKIDQTGVSLWPSLWMPKTNSCGSHFWLRHSKVIWAQVSDSRFEFEAGGSDQSCGSIEQKLELPAGK